MNPYRIKAREAGADFYKSRPCSEDTDVDAAATEYCPFDPCRRDFQQGFYFARERHEARLDRLYKPFA